MKNTLLMAVLMFVFPASLPGRVLKSADGGKALDAQFVRYVASRDMVTLRQTNGQNMVAPAAKFSEEDRNFFVEAQKEIDKKEAIKVKVDPSNDFSKEALGYMVYSYRTSKYAFKVTNSSESYFDGLELRYWIVLQKYGNKGDEQIKIQSDRKQLMPLYGGGSEIVESPSMKLTLGAKTAVQCACPTAAKDLADKAGSVERDRVLGTKVEVVDATGQVIYSDVSSERVKILLADQKSG